MTEETTETTDQPIEESQVQPEVSPEEGEQEEVLTEDQPQEEESEEEPTFEINGEQVPLSELQQGYMRNSDYTKKTQEIAELKRQATAPKAELTDEQKQVQEFIQGNNLMTTAQFNQLIQDNNEIMSLKSKGMTPKQEAIVQSLSKSTGLTSTGTPFVRASMAEIYEDVFGGAVAESKPQVIKKKVVGMKPKSNDKGSSGLTREAISKMSMEDYEKNLPKIQKAMADGTL